jgi:hypothetical protein
MHSTCVLPKRKLRPQLSKSLYAPIMKMELRSRALDKLYKRRDRIEMPDFQREEVWEDDKKRLLIDSILRGWHLPKFYFRKTGEGTFECVDGQQRLTTIWEFYDNKLELDKSTAKKFGGKTYRELNEDFSDAFDDFEADIEEIEDATDEELRTLFLRLQLGTPLNTAEKLNAIGGEMCDFCQRISKQSFFTEKIPLKDTRFAHFAITTQWMFVEARGVQPQMRFRQLQAFLNENQQFSDKSETAIRVKAALKYMHQTFPKSCDKLRNKANVLSVCMLAARVVAHNLHKRSTDAFGKFVESFFSDLAAEVEKGSKSTRREMLDYQEAISYGSAAGESIRNRLNILTQSLVTTHPEFAPLLGERGASKTATERAISKKGDSISKALHKVNEKYAATHGEDLFKMTNASILALKNLTRSISDSESYGRLVDDLYFIIYEGSGSCKRLSTPVPEFAMDVKFLRTGLRHDLDHGDAGEVTKKRVRKGAVFEKFSGKKSPLECGPEDFLAIQLSGSPEKVDIVWRV